MNKKRNPKVRGIRLLILIAIFNLFSPPTKSSRWMIWEQPRLPWSAVDVFSIRPPRHSIVVPEESPGSQLRKQQLNDVFERTRIQGIRLRYIVSSNRSLL